MYRWTEPAPPAIKAQRERRQARRAVKAIHQAADKSMWDAKRNKHHEPVIDLLKLSLALTDLQ